MKMVDGLLMFGSIATSSVKSRSNARLNRLYHFLIFQLNPMQIGTSPLVAQGLVPVVASENHLGFLRVYRIYVVD